MGFVTSHRWCRTASNVSGPEPSIAALNAMLDELTTFIEQTGSRPVALECASWHRPEGVKTAGVNDFLCRIRVEVEPGLSPNSFRCWFQWQHPRWEWARQETFPERFSLAAADSAGQM